MIRFLPGLAAAVAAFGGLKLAGWLGSALWLELVVFLATWMVVAVVVDRGMRRYGTPKADA